MLANAAVVETVVESVRRFDIHPLVVDPVMVASSGDVLLAPEAVAAVRSNCCRWQTWLPRTSPRRRCCWGGRCATGRDARGRRAGGDGRSCRAVKGGHLTGEEMVDVLYDGERYYAPRAPSSGGEPARHRYALSAAIAACLALGYPLAVAVERSVDFVRRAIETAPGLGSGRGPLNHFTRPALF